MKQDLGLTPFYMLLYREIRRYMKVVVQTVLTPLVTSSLYLLIFGVSLGGSIEIGEGINYLAFLVPGLVMMGCLNNAFQNSSSSIVSAKFAGDLEDFRVAPLSNQQIIWAFAIGGLTRGLMVGVVTFLVGEGFYFLSEGEWLAVANPGVVLFFLICGGLGFAKLGLAVALWAKTIDQLSAVGTFVLTPLIFLGGVFYSIDNLHPFWQTVSKFNPLLYLINGVRHGILGVSDVDPWVAAGVSVAAIVGFHLILVVSLRRGSFTRW